MRRLRQAEYSAVLVCFLGWVSTRGSRLQLSLSQRDITRSYWMSASKDRFSGICLTKSVEKSEPSDGIVVWVMAVDWANWRLEYRVDLPNSGCCFVDRILGTGTSDLVGSESNIVTRGLSKLRSAERLIEDRKQDTVMATSFAKKNYDLLAATPGDVSCRWNRLARRRSGWLVALGRLGLSK